MRGQLLWLLGALMGHTAAGGSDTTLPHLKAFRQLPPPTLARFSLDADCILRSEQFGLNVASNVCWDGRLLFLRCPERTTNKSQDLDDFFNFLGTLLPAEDFDARLANRSVQWLNGTSFLMTSHLWPHNVQHAWPVLNVAALGLPLRRIGVYRDAHYGTSGVQQPYCLGLIRAFADFLNVSVFPSRSFFNAGRYWDSFSPSRPLCFEQVVVPNKGPSPRFHTCTGAFMSPLVIQRQKQAFLEHFYAKARARVLAKNNGIGPWLPTFPKSPPRKALILNRRKDRVMLNADAVVAMIEALGLPAGEVVMEGKSLDEQFLHMAQAGLLVSPHGANLINSLFMAPRSAAIEVFLLPLYYSCEWAQYLQSSGVQCLQYCWNDGKDCPHAPPGPYPRANASVDVDRLRRTVKLALRLMQ